MKTLGRLLWWWLDYVYAGWQQFRSVFQRAQPAEFAEGDPALPAIILLPGVYETWFFLRPLARRLNAQGYRVFAVPELSFNRMPLTRSADVASASLQALHAAHSIGDVVLLAHSKGGLIGKQLMIDHPQMLEASASGIRILGMVAIATPFSGSRYAQYFLSPALRAFAPNDALLVKLSKQQQVNQRVVSIYAEFDPHIPAKSTLVGAHNVELPITGHFVLLSNKLLASTVEKAVAGLHS